MKPQQVQSPTGDPAVITGVVSINNSAAGIYITADDALLYHKALAEINSKINVMSSLSHLNMSNLLRLLSAPQR